MTASSPDATSCRYCLRGPTHHHAWPCESNVACMQTKRPPKGGLSVALLGAGDQAARRVHRGKHIIIRRSHRYALPQGGRGDEVAGHSFRTGRPCSQPSRTHGPNGALWQPGPQPSAAMAVPVIANMIKQHPRRAGRRIIVEAPIDLRDQPGNASGSPRPECQP